MGAIHDGDHLSFDLLLTEQRAIDAMQIPVTIPSVLVAKFGKHGQQRGFIVQAA